MKKEREFDHSLEDVHDCVGISRSDREAFSERLNAIHPAKQSHPSELLESVAKAANDIVEAVTFAYIVGYSNASSK